MKKQRETSAIYISVEELQKKELREKIEHLLENYIKFIGDNEHTYNGSPSDIVKELFELIEQEKRKSVEDRKYVIKDLENRNIILKSWMWFLIGLIALLVWFMLSWIPLWD
jgi:hypothetical protein